MRVRCGEEAHQPAGCPALAEWAEKCQNESETANWILANTKRCPKCNTPIEKNEGCSSMMCGTRAHGRVERGRRRHVAPRHRNDVHAARQVAALARLDDPDDGKRLARGPRDDVRRARHRHADVARRPSPGRRGHVEGGQERGAEPGVGARRHVAAARPERVRRAAF